jgi:hypothetical protein
MTMNESRQLPDARLCPSCDAIPRFVRQILNPQTGKSVRMFECKCGKNSWSE